ncbi:MAG: hypothetical protein Q9224_005758 [Gallowayella concinna]
MATAAVEIPPSNHGIPGSHMLAHVDLPEIIPNFSNPIDPQGVAISWLQLFNDLINGHEVKIEDIFLDESYWRDFLCSTWNFHTYHGLPKIFSVLSRGDRKCRLKSLSIDSSSDIKKPSICPIDFNGTIQGLQAFLTVETDVGSGRGLVKLVQDPKAGGKWKAFILFTTLQELKGYEESVHTRRPTGVNHGANPGRLNWQERRNVEANCEGSLEPTVLIIGQYAQQSSTTELTGCRRWAGRIDYRSSIEAIRCCNGDH